ncbi:MAG: gliding motility-associated C-terminal domain-containing protein, partial [Bacteroidia bacterium]|nr:gliding motility-associated C-terminal domain-containing protein [Bacteroidia bacterium]
DPAVAQRGTHKVVYTFTDGRGCSNRDSSTIQVDSVPDASIAAAGPFCENDTIQQLTGQVNQTGLFTASAYIDTAGNFDPSVAQTGSHMVFYTFVDGNGCSNTDSLSVAVDSIPNAGIAPAGPFCENDTVSVLTAQYNGGGVFKKANYIDTVGNFDPSKALKGQHWVYYTFVDGNGCSNTDSLQLQVDSIPDARISAAGPFCENADTQRLVGLTNIGGKFVVTAYLDSTGLFDPAVAQRGTHKVVYTFTDGRGCSNRDSSTIQVDSIPNASITAAGPFCENDTIQQLTGAAVTTGRFTPTIWLDTLGKFDPGIARRGAHKVFYTVTDGNNCVQTDSTTITVDSIPDARFTSSSPYCDNGGADTLNPLTNLGGRFTGGSYIDSAGVFDPVVAGKGNHWVLYSFSDGNGCSAVDSAIVVVDSITPVTLTSGSPYCVNDTVQKVIANPNLGGRFSGGSFIDSAGNFDPAGAMFGNHKLFFRQTNGNNCSTFDSIQVFVDTLPDARIFPVANVCANGDSIRIVPRVQGGRFYGGSYVDSVGWFQPTTAGVGIHKVYYSIENSSGCLKHDSVWVTVDSVPDASITPAGPFCANAGVQNLTTLNTYGSFTVTSYLDAAGRFDPGSSGIGNFKVFYTLTDGNGCSNIDSIQVRVDSVPDASITSAGPFCLNAGVQQITGQVNTTGTFTQTSYITSAGQFDPNLSGTGSHRVFYTFTDGNGCTTTDSTDIAVDTLPDASIFAAGPFCENAGVQRLIPAVNTGGKFVESTYLDTLGDFDPAIAQVGVHKALYVFTDGNGCTNVDSIEVQVDSVPDAQIAPAGPVCQNGGVLTLSGLNNTGGKFTETAYLDTNGVFDPLLTVPGSYKVYYRFTDGNGCSNIDSAVIQVDTIPDASIALPAPRCLNDGVMRLQPTVTGGRFYGGVYIDSIGDFDPLQSGVGSHKVYYRLTDGNGCVSIDSSVVRVDSIPDAQITPAGPFCSNAGIQTLTALVNTGGSFEVAAYLNAAGQFDPFVAQPGLHRVYYGFIDGNGCSGRDSIDITVDTLPDARINPLGPLCLNDAAEVLTATFNPGGSFTGTGVNGLGEFDPLIAQPGTHKVYYTFVDGNACSNSDSIDVTVWSLPDAGMPNYGPYCANDDPVQIVANTGGGSFTGGGYVTNAGNFDPTLAAVGLNKVVHAVIDGNGCTSLDSIDIEVHDIPTNTLVLDPHEGCELLDVQVSTQQNGDEDSVRWEIAGQVYTNVFQIQDQYVAGVYPVRLEVFTAEGCRIELDSSFEVFPKPVAQFDYSPEDVYISNPQVFFRDQSLGNVVGWDWDFGDGGSSVDQNPDYSYSDAGTYQVQLFIENSNGCLDTTEQQVVVLDELLVFIPNAISPNNDGINDVFRITGMGYTNIKIEIFNRWGERIYDSTDFTQWDGTYQGERVQLGSYLYIMTITDNRGRRHQRNGEVTVVR